MKHKGLSLFNNNRVWIMELGQRQKRFWLAMLMILLVGGICIAGLPMAKAECIPPDGCDIALAYYKVAKDDTLEKISNMFQTTIKKLEYYNDIRDPDNINNGTYLYVPFPCPCVGNRLGYTFLYELQPGESIPEIASYKFEGLSRQEWIEAATPVTDPNAVFIGFFLKVPVNCSCGDPKVSTQYGVFTTYVVQENDNLTTISDRFSITSEFVKQYNSMTNWGRLTPQQDIIFIPFKGIQGREFLFNTSELGGGGRNTAAIVGASVGGGITILMVAAIGIFCFCIYLPKKDQDRANKNQFPALAIAQEGFSADSARKQGASRQSWEANSATAVSSGTVPVGMSGLTGDNSVEFSYEELAAATNNFSINNKIGEGGYGAVYYGGLRGQKLAIKRMNLQARTEFLAELKVLTHVHHTNLVQLIGFCTVESLFLIYEYVDNGTLSQHLHGSVAGMPPLSWTARVQIALDAARGLEYIHEHTKPTYIHRDVKSSNILIDKNYRAKVADFGLTKLTESGYGSLSMTQPTRLVGTFGYMSPEYARLGDVSPKVDVYSFGVVLFEIISAKEAIVRSSSKSSTSSAPQDQRGLVTLFEAVLKDSDGKEKLRSLVDPALGNDYPLDFVWKMAQLAGACTQENPELRPIMRTAVVALMTLSSSTQEWEISGYGGGQVLGSLMSGK